jgi:hypothetical protein
MRWISPIPLLDQINLKIEAKHYSAPEHIVFFYTDSIVLNPYWVFQS